MKLSLLLLGTLLLLSGCTGRNAYAVEISEIGEFSPSSLTIPVGTTVVWKNMDTLPQTATYAPGLALNGETGGAVTGGATGGAEANWDSGTLYPGETWSRTFDVPGAYVYASRYPKNRYHSSNDNTAIGFLQVVEAPSQ